MKVIVPIFIFITSKQGKSSFKKNFISDELCVVADLEFSNTKMIDHTFLKTAIIKFYIILRYFKQPIKFFKKYRCETLKKIIFSDSLLITIFRFKHGERSHFYKVTYKITVRSHVCALASDAYSSPRLYVSWLHR
jgi:hypothetical protein